MTWDGKERRSSSKEFHGQMVDIFNTLMDRISTIDVKVDNVQKGLSSLKEKVNDIDTLLQNDNIGALSRLEKIEESLNGNGKKGLKTEIDEIKGDIKMINAKIVFVSVIAGFVIKLVSDWLLHKF